MIGVYSFSVQALEFRVLGPNIGEANGKIEDEMNNGLLGM